VVSVKHELSVHEGAALVWWAKIMFGIVKKCAVGEYPKS